MVVEWPKHYNKKIKLGSILDNFGHKDSSPVEMSSCLKPGDLVLTRYKMVSKHVLQTLNLV